MIGGIYFAGAPFAGMLKQGITAAALAAQATIGLTSTANLSEPPFRMEAAATTIDLVTARADLRVPIDTSAGIWIGGINVTGRVKVQGLTIHDILNDAPNTATFQLRLEAPAVGQAVRIQMGTRVLFTGAVQTVDQAYESKPEHLIWNVTAIDDTAAANRRRPFGTWFETSATTIAQSLTATYAPGFSSAGIAAGLPAVTIVFDGADPFIACLTRLATAVGGYCKVEQGTVYLFTEDTADPPAAIDDDHRFLSNPPIQVNTDSSQLRTRVYGKGYGENVPTDIAAGETLLPIQDGALFPPLGGTAIVGLTADGAQSDTIAFQSVLRPVGGTLVGPGAAPANAPTMALAAGGVVTSGLHEVSVVHVTGVGTSLAGPRGSITTGAMPAPGAALTAGTAVNGTGPDQGSHDYVVTNLVLGGETTPGPVSNAVTTSAAAGQLAPPGNLVAQMPANAGPGLDDGLHAYVVTLVNANGETTPGPEAGYYNITAPNSQLQLYGIPTGPAGTTGRRIYRAFNGAPLFLLVTTIGDNTTTTFLDTKANSARGAAAPSSNTTGTAVQRVPLTAIPLGPGGTTGRRIYRRFNGAGTFKLVTELGNNSSTTFNDGVGNSALGAAAPTGNTAVGNQINLSGIPTGGSSTTAREIYMTQAGGGTLRLALTIADNTTRDAVLNVADATLAGAATPPATDTSGLQQPQGQVNPGSPTLIVASPAPFLSTGGWVVTGGGQVIRYTGISGQLLTGVPASGPGAIVTTILYGQQALPAPMLTGVTGLARAMLKGSAVHIWIQRDDLQAQAEQAARTGGDGIVEFLIVDQRRGVDSLAARCVADLAQFSRPIITISYATRDLKTKSGKTILVDLPSQGILQTLTIQDVTITELDLAPNLPPRFTVTASSVRFSLEDTLRRLITVGPVTVNT